MADEENGVVSVLCYACRHSADSTKQQGLKSFFAPKPSEPADVDEVPANEDEVPVDAVSGHDARQCSKCRRVMEQKTNRSTDKSVASTASSTSRVLPQISRLRQYQRIASEQGIPFTITETAAAAMMREPCTICGVRAPEGGHGLTRLRIWPEGVAAPAKGGFMGPYHPANLATACGTCNLMKGARRVRGFVEAARHIATHRGDRDFGRYPHRFRNNVSKRSRSCYVTASSTHSKTHALSNETFNAIVSRPCHYCGKPSDPPHHHNGLDRLDSSVRLHGAYMALTWRLQRPRSSRLVGAAVHEGVSPYLPISPHISPYHRCCCTVRSHASLAV